MSGFKALNIESDDESDIEIDDTKELQIEEALKLYQNALRYHAEGAGSFELAAAAYEDLFQSDIFTYPESQTELRRIELYGPSPDSDSFFSNDTISEVTRAPTTLDSGPSSLPQILSLSHKNYAQFKLDSIVARVQQSELTLTEVLNGANAALNHFVEALDKDDTDLDLWRRAAEVGDILSTTRLERFCLEAVMDGDEEGMDGLILTPGLEQCLVARQLRNLIQDIGDWLSRSQVEPNVHHTRALSSLLKQRMISFSRIADVKTSLREQHQNNQACGRERVTLRIPRTWAELGEALLSQLSAEQRDTSSVVPGAAISFDLGGTTPPAKERIELALGDMEQEPTGHAASERIPVDGDAKPDKYAQIAMITADTGTSHKTRDDHKAKASEVVDIAFPTRKRSGDAAGLHDGLEEGRTKSKRTRTRDSTTAEESRQAIRDANIQWEFEQQLNEIQAADDWMFETVGNMFERIGVVGFDAARTVRQDLQNSESGGDGPTVEVPNRQAQTLRLAQVELNDFLNDYSDEISSILLDGDNSFDATDGIEATGFRTSTLAKPANDIMPHKQTRLSEHGLLALLHEINDGWMDVKEVAWRWLSALLRPPDSGSGTNTYLESLWAEDLKTMVVRNLVTFDDDNFGHASHELATLKNDVADASRSQSIIDMIQTVFELHLDIYCLIKQPNSGVDRATIDTQSHRLSRWSGLAQEASNVRSLLEPGSSATPDKLSLRFLWAMTFHVSAQEQVPQDHVLACMSDLRSLLSTADATTIQLQNNAIMPEISISALDQEISRLTTRDFFLKVTNHDVSDPVDVIESLEPILLLLSGSGTSMEAVSSNGDAAMDPSVTQELLQFLQGSDVSLRIRLWQRLRDAYLAIDYKPMVVFCYVNMAGILMRELDATNLNARTKTDRQRLVLNVLRLLCDIVAKALNIIQSTENALECIDEQCLKKTVTMFGGLMQLLQVFNIFEDHIRVGQNQPPTSTNDAAVISFTKTMEIAHETQVNAWMILYSLLKEANFQFTDAFPTPVEDMFDFLRTVHRNLGLRGICGVSNRAFVKLLRDEFRLMTHIDGYDSEQAQVLYDLYGLNCFLNPSYELMDHRCIHDAFLDRGVALQAVDLLLQQASKLQMKELIKHSLKDTIDKVHGAAPRKKPTEAIMRNRDVCRAFLRSPISPVTLFQCLQGEGSELEVSHVLQADASLAVKGWYFLMGHIALAKFRSQKRTTQTPTEDVDIAIAFFMQDLESGVEKWETWFRLAQAYDTKIEESIVWSAERLNSNMPEIVQLQRAAIHCFTMATALAYRSADLSYETSEKMTELMTDFGMRLYSSSRDPFGMRAFELDDAEKFFSFPTGVLKGKPFRRLHANTAWKLATVMFQRALIGNPQSWALHFAIGKCLWKMHSSPSGPVAGKARPTAMQVLAPFVRALELLPNKRDSREKREPILEPHYKIVSIVHKLFTDGSIGLNEAAEALSNTCYARTDDFPRARQEWIPYILGVLKRLRAADKSNWHHRIIGRIASIVYKHPQSQETDMVSIQHAGAQAAKHELTQQMFTKTMVLQVWKPDSERPGRHFVYTARYTRFFVQVLEELNDRVNLEQLARRVRRRPHDVFEHSLVWQDICNAYLRQLRAYGHLADGLETSTFSNIAHEDFLARKDLLEAWMQAQEVGENQPLDVLREVQELKKINQSLMKTGPIDDLIGDSYAYLFNTIGKQLLDDERKLKQEEEAKRPPPVVSPPRNPMMSLTHLMNVDGVNEVSIPPAQPAAVPPQPDAPVRRKLGVGRREIRTSAEACLPKTSGVASHSFAPSIKATGPFPKVQVIIEAGRRQSVTGIASLETSAPGSIHDSADDESELSSLEEEADEEDHRPRPLFPGLLSNISSRATSEGFETADEELGSVDEGVDVAEQNGPTKSPQPSVEAEGAT